MSSLAEDFWSRVDKRGPDECWEWTSTRNAYGYGVIYRMENGKRVCHIASRLAIRFTSGPIPKGHWALHSCDNPPCCNPAHLRVGTPAENSADMRARGRSRKGSATKAARLTEDQVLEIRRRYATGNYSQAALAKEYGIGQMTVSWLVRRVTWAHI